MKIGHLTSCCALLFSTVLHAQTDQTLEWASYFGGNSSSGGVFVTWPNQFLATPNGSMLACGWTDTPENLVVLPAHQISMQGESSGFIARIDENRDLEFATYFGGEDFDFISDVAVFSNSGFVIVGLTGSNSGISTPGAFMPVKPGGYNGFIARFSPGGLLLWSTYLGGEAGAMEPGTIVASVVVDDEDNVYCVGTTSSAFLPTSANAHQSDLQGGRDGFVARFNPDGQPVFITYFGGSEDDRLTSIAFAENGDLLLTGTTWSSSGISTSGSYQEEIAGGADIFITRMTTEGEVVWSTYFGGNQDDFLGEASSSHHGMDVDEEGNIYVSLRTESEGLQTTGITFFEIDHYQLILLAKFNPQGTLEWSRYMPYRPVESYSGLRYCGETLVYYGAAYTGADDLSIGTPFQSEVVSLTETDIVLVGLDVSGELQWGTFYGGEGRDLPSSVDCLGESQLLLSGTTRSNNIEITPDAFQPERSSYTNAIFAIFEIDGLTSVEHNEELELKAYPNPTTQHLWLDLPSSFAFHAEVGVYNSVGQLVQRHTQFSSHEPLSLQHPPGLYIVEARKGDNALRAKVVVR